MDGSGRAVRRLALIGLDGATFRVLDPLGAEGVLPNLTRLRERGLEAVLRSTIPAYTPPAWISMATGVNPGRHGVFGFLDSTPQESPRIAHSGLIDAVPMWRYLSDIGSPVGVLNVPMSYPPHEVSGFMVAGGLASGWTDPEMPGFASSPEIASLVGEVAGEHYPLDVPVNYERDWRSPAVTDRLQHAQELRQKVLAALIERFDPQVVFAVFEGPDRIQHVHYQYLVECSEWYGRPEASELRARDFAFFAAVDRAVGDLVDWAGDDGVVVVVSDHGAGPWEKTVNSNLLLQSWGYLQLPKLSVLTRAKLVAGPVQRAARRILPMRLLQKAKARVGAGIAWDRSRAFSSHVAEQGIHINEREALPRGVVDPAEVPGIEEEIAERFGDLMDPDDGRPVTDRVYRRQEVIRGPHASRAPHLFPILRDQRYELSDTLAADSPFTDHRDRPWGYHHVDGVFLAAGPGVKAERLGAGLDIVDVLPTAFHLGGIPVPQGLDGRVVTEALAGEAAARPVTTAQAETEQQRSGENPFSPEEEAQIEESLRGLGYLE
jgi:predicted AlkP superfamily phosphohydrolase/phosphomutase